MLSWGLTRIRFFRESGLPIRHIVIYYWLKVAAAVGYGYYHAEAQRGGDTWSYHRDGLLEAELLRSNPVKFVTTLFYSGYQEKWGGFFSTRNSWWNDLDANTIPKLLGICNLFTNSNYYVNAVFVNFLFLFGPVLGYRAWSKVLPGAGTFWRYLPFLLPSFLFWTSGIHKEGFLFLALSMVVHALLSFERKRNPRNILLLLSGLLAILVLRNFLLLPVLLLIAGYTCVYFLQIKPAVSFCAVIFLSCSLFFASSLFSPQMSLPRLLHERRTTFLQKKGKSKIEAMQLEATSGSFAKNAPAAFVNGAFRPLPTDVYNVTSAIAAAEGLLIFFLPGIALFTLRTFPQNANFLLICLLLCLPVFFIIGYAIPFSGAVVRYRSVVLPFWMMALLLMAMGKLRR